MPRNALVLGLLVAVAAPQLSAQEPQPSADESQFSARKPQLAPERAALVELPDSLATLNFAEGLRVVDEQGPLVTFWLADPLPKQEEPTGEFSVDFRDLPPGAVVGVVEFHRDWSDYRKRIVTAGTYSMRYGIRPADEDHMGQTYFRDFLMLLPVTEDGFPVAGLSEAEPLIELSKKTTGTEHPGVIALYQIYELLEGPAVVRNDFDEPCLAVPFKGLVMGLVLFGHGRELPV
ncbi:MAG: hypothetical protein AAGA81_07300 [Acidobacteriota bacterium]